jgi:4,5-DOPA dioxygenase extradiol
MSRLSKLNRRSFIAGALGLAGVYGLTRVRSAKELTMLFDSNQNNDSKMPALFIGHGSPMNAIEDNVFSRRWTEIGNEIGKPKAILCISAHWLSAGTWVTAMQNPKTIHDFYGFPQELFAVQYPAKGNQILAEEIRELVKRPKIQADEKSWGLDHGTWSVLNKMYPEADVPVLQLSIDMSEPASFHYELGKSLRALRERGVMILGSGNIVHNLRRIDWGLPQQGSSWALQFDEWAKGRLENRDHKALTEDFMSSQEGRLSVPTPDHYLPMLYVLGASDEKDHLKFEVEGCDMGSISMRSFSFGRKV